MKIHPLTGPAHHIILEYPDDDAVRVFQPLLKRRTAIVRRQFQLTAKGFGSRFQLREVVVPLVDRIAHGLGRAQLPGPVAALELGGEIR